MKKRSSYRGERLGEEIRRIISELISRELKDPVFDGMISVSHVKATDDASFATVYFTCMGADEAEALAGFEKAKGFIRNEIGRKLGIRRAPDLRFKPDEAERYGQRIDTLLNELDLPKEDEREGRTLGTLAELFEIIDSHDRYLIFTHIHMDGDTFGASVAFADAMREVGREAWVVCGEEPPRTIEFINAPFVIGAEEAEALFGVAGGEADGSGGEESGDDGVEKTAPYLAIAMDFADPSRLEGREALFDGAEETLCIDHHITSRPVCDYNYIEPAAAATAEIVYRLLRLAKLPVTERAATAIYVGVLTDTGRFQYHNTTPETHRIAAELLEAGADMGTAYRDIFQSVKAEKLFVQSEMLNTLDIFADGRAALASIRADVLTRLGAGEDETDGMSETLRSIIGVEVSAFLKELKDGKIKASMRSKDKVDVAALAAEFGGGGHVRAAGFTTELPLAEIAARLKEKLTAALEAE